MAELTPGSPDKKVFYSQSGAAAVEAAIKGARLFQYNRVFKEAGAVDAPSQYPFPYKIISRYQSWHGASSGAASASGDPRRWFQEPLAVPGVVFAPDANPHRPHFESVERHLSYLDHLVEQEGGREQGCRLSRGTHRGKQWHHPSLPMAIWKAFAIFAIDGISS